jgi:hypothetical protein
MKPIKTEEFEIIKDSTNKFVYTITFDKESKSLIRSLIKTGILQDATVYNDYKTVIFKAHSVKMLQSCTNFSYESALKMAFFLTNQLDYLIDKESECFYQYTTENIIIIDNAKYGYLSNEHLIKMDDDKKSIIFTTPFDRDGFVSPELLKIKTIPAKTNYKTIYYSLGLLLINCLFEKSDNNDLSILNPIKDTKLFYLIKRCLELDVDKRLIYYI